MVKVDWLLVEVASLTVGGCYEARPLGVGRWLLVLTGQSREAGCGEVVARRRLGSL
jgi:hypothetical protein